MRQQIYRQASAFQWLLEEGVKSFASVPGTYALQSGMNNRLRRVTCQDSYMHTEVYTLHVIDVCGRSEILALAWLSCLRICAVFRRNNFACKREQQCPLGVCHFAKTEQKLAELA